MSRRARYRLGQRIGTGGMAEVFLGRREGAAALATPLAIKRILPALVEKKGAAEMLVNEARIASRLRHPNLVPVLDVDRDEQGVPFLVMDLVHGVSLEALAQEGPLPFPVVAYVMVEMLQGLAYLHAHRDEDGQPLHLVHRDVSPRNVLVSRGGEVKLTDFGIARSYAATRSRVSGLQGTLCYLSPEQIQGLRLDGRSDLFAAGAILYELLTGRPAFPGSNAGVVITAILHQALTPPRAIRPEVPAGLEAVTMRLLQRERDQRFAHAQDVIDAMHQWKDEASTAREDLAARVARLCERLPTHEAGHEPSDGGISFQLIGDHPREERAPGGHTRARKAVRAILLLLVAFLAGPIARWAPRDAAPPPVPATRDALAIDHAGICTPPAVSEPPISPPEPPGPAIPSAPPASVPVGPAVPASPHRAPRVRRKPSASPAQSRQPNPSDLAVQQAHWPSRTFE